MVGDEYINRKDYANINVQTTCNAEERIMSTSAEWPGSKRFAILGNCIRVSLGINLIVCCALLHNVARDIKGLNFDEDVDEELVEEAGIEVHDNIATKRHAITAVYVCQSKSEHFAITTRKEYWDIALQLGRHQDNASVAHSLALKLTSANNRYIGFLGKYIKA
ncbi:hypothetical protein J6590_032847 [Homalodisca vitripennis]|nr:hypothetical protein J6590_032847 [Homalodisca vitripennis]